MATSGPSSSRKDTEVCRRFQSAWWNRQPQPLESYLPAEDHSDYLATLEELVLLEIELAYQFREAPPCHDTTAAATAAAGDGTGGGGPGHPLRTCPAVEDYLARFPRLNQPTIVTRLAAQEFLVRRRHGEAPSTEAYRERFPAFVAPSETTPLTSTSPTAAAARAVAELPKLQGYDVLKRLGRGAMGVVYLARQVDLDRLVALKMIVSGAAADPEELTRFRTEAEAMAHLMHPNIIQVYETTTQQRARNSVLRDTAAPSQPGVTAASSSI
jgi:hypothetical protein